MKITIVGNISFLDKFKEAESILEKNGHKVIVPKKELMPEPIPSKIKRELMKDFIEDVKKSDAILVMNYTKNGKENYIGTNSLMEIGIAFLLRKKVFLLNPSPEYAKHEIDAIEAIILDGNLSKIDN
jgi:nucleoside 2-deoxyribosyltransferase